MPSLKELRNRIGSVRSTRKITSAMKMVAASKLRRAQEQAEAGQPYADRMGRMLARLAGNTVVGPESPKLLTGTGKDEVHLLIIMTSDRGLCGGFNSALAREARRQINQLVDAGKQVKLLIVGRKSRDLLRRDHQNRFVEAIEGIGRPRLSFDDAANISEIVLSLFEQSEFDVCTVLYNRFKSVISQVPTATQLIPFSLDAFVEEEQDEAAAAEEAARIGVYEFEPDEQQILEELLPFNLAIQIYRALLDSGAGEQAARMTAMDNATRNAGDMINKLTLNYNRARQAAITKELIEIISGAEAV